MNKYVKLIMAVLAVAAYYLALRYVAPAREPYFVLGLGVIGYVAWLYGVSAGVVTALILTPLTLHIYKQFDVVVPFPVLSPPYIAIQLFIAVCMGKLNGMFKKLTSDEQMVREANQKLQNSLGQVREMGGIHSLCSTCKSIMDDDGTWTKIDTYLKDKTKVEFSHAICPDCAAEYQNEIETPTEKSAEQTAEAEIQEFPSEEPKKRSA